MIMNALDALSVVEKSKGFKVFMSEEKDSYLANVFVFIESNTPPKEWHVSYYSPKTNLLTAFVTKDAGVERQGASEALKSEQKIEGLDTKKVKLSSDQALMIASKHQFEHYRTERPIKIIVILQEYKKKTVYNITYITQSFKTLNMKIDADSGKVVSHDLVSLIDTEALKDLKK